MAIGVEVPPPSVVPVVVREVVVVARVVVVVGRLVMTGGRVVVVVGDAVVVLVGGAAVVGGVVSGTVVGTVVGSVGRLGSTTRMSAPTLAAGARPTDRANAPRSVRPPTAKRRSRRRTGFTLRDGDGTELAFMCW